MATQQALIQLQSKLGYSFRDKKHLEEALVHDSNRVNDRTMPTYQRLEFLGDSVLYLVVSDYLFRNNPSFTEGQMTAKRKECIEAVKQAQIAEKLNLKDCISFGQSVNREQFSRYHSFVESLIGAVYIDGGLEPARQVIHRLWELGGSSATTNAASNCTIA